MSYITRFFDWLLNKNELRAIADEIRALRIVLERQGLPEVKAAYQPLRPLQPLERK